jgi:hypothetical protein
MAYGEKIKLSEVVHYNCYNLDIQLRVSKRNLDKIKNQHSLNLAELNSSRRLHNSGHVTESHFFSTRKLVENSQYLIDVALEKLEYTDTALRISRIAYKLSLKEK